MKNSPRKSITVLGLAIFGLVACSQASHDNTLSQAKTKVTETAEKVATQKPQKSVGFEYVAMEGFSHDMGKWVGLKEGDSFAEAEVKINAAFKAYDGHAEPKNIGMDAQIVEADWKQVLVTQDGIMDGTVTGQQLLAVFDEEKKLVSYGMRIKCHTAQGDTNWQAAACE